MAEFHFYGSAGDACQVLRACFDADPRLLMTPARNYATAEVPYYSSLCDDLLKSLDVNRVLYVTGPFSPQPLRLQQIQGGKYPGTWVVDLSRCGSALKLNLPTAKKLRDNTWHLIPGSLFCQNRVWHDDAGRAVAPPQELKLAYRALVRTLKGSLQQREVDGSVWLGPEANQLLENRQALILVHGKWLTGSGEFVRSNTPRG